MINTKTKKKQKQKVKKNMQKKQRIYIIKLKLNKFFLKAKKIANPSFPQPLPPFF